MNDQNSNIDNNEPPVLNFENNQSELPPTVNYNSNAGTGQLSGLTKAGLIIQIIIASAVLLAVFISLTNIIFVMALAGSGIIATLVLSILALTKKTRGLVIAAGILGILFTGILAGVLTLAGNGKN